MGRISKHRKHKAADLNGNKSKGQLANIKEKSLAATTTTTTALVKWGILICYSLFYS